MPPKTPPAKAANNGRPPTDRSPDPAAAITNNYMKLPNDVVDDLMRSSSPIQFKVLMVALRQTIGYNRNVARIPVRKVEEIANIRRGAALEALRFWQGAGLITRTDARESGRSAVYSLNLIELQDGEVGANAQLLNSDNRFGRPVCQAYRFDRETALGKASKSPRGLLRRPLPVRSANHHRFGQQTGSGPLSGPH